MQLGLCAWLLHLLFCCRCSRLVVIEDSEYAAWWLANLRV